jgi:glyoxylase-like metal-dependent hydrolase (beta-lactamase superfamily II)
MKLFSLETGIIKFDGGSMFGIIPRIIWQELYPPDNRHYCHFAMRCLLIVHGERRIIIDTGIGSKQSKSFLRYYTEKKDYSLESSIKKAGYSMNDITDVVLTHLHFDHCGGCFYYNDKMEMTPSFPNARYHVSKQQWEWAINPNERESPSFLEENIKPIHESGRLDLFDHEHELFPDFFVKLFNGHTDGQVIPNIKINGKTIVFCADLFPTTLHLQQSYIMAYDTRPTITIEDKKRFFCEFDPESCILFFEHDLYTECCTFKIGEKGPQIDKRITLAQWMNMNLI